MTKNMSEKKKNGEKHGYQVEDENMRDFKEQTHTEE